MRQTRVSHDAGRTYHAHDDKTTSPGLARSDGDLGVDDSRAAALKRPRIETEVPVDGVSDRVAGKRDGLVRLDDAPLRDQRSQDCGGRTGSPCEDSGERAGPPVAASTPWTGDSIRRSPP